MKQSLITAVYFQNNSSWWKLLSDVGFWVQQYISLPLVFQIRAPHPQGDRALYKQACLPGALALLESLGENRLRNTVLNSQQHLKENTEPERNFLFEAGQLHTAYTSLTTPLILTVKTSGKLRAAKIQTASLLGNPEDDSKDCKTQVVPNYYLTIYTWFGALGRVFLQQLQGGVWRSVILKSEVSTTPRMPNPTQRLFFTACKLRMVFLFFNG